MPDNYMTIPDQQAEPSNDTATQELKKKLAELTNARAEANSSTLLQFFAFEHLPPHLQVISRPFGEMAQHLVNTLPCNVEREAALRKLLEAKDCAVRALVYKAPPSAPF